MAVINGVEKSSELVWPDLFIEREAHTYKGVLRLGTTVLKKIVYNIWVALRIIIGFDNVYSRKIVTYVNLVD